MDLGILNVANLLTNAVDIFLREENRNNRIRNKTPRKTHTMVLRTKVWHLYLHVRAFSSSAVLIVVQHLCGYINIIIIFYVCIFLPYLKHSTRDALELRFGVFPHRAHVLRVWISGDPLTWPASTRGRLRSRNCRWRVRRGWGWAERCWSPGRNALWCWFSDSAQTHTGNLHLSTAKKLFVLCFPSSIHDLFLSASMLA